MLPITKSIPKELLPIWNSILLFENIKTLFNVGFRDFIIVNNESKKIIEDYLAINYDLEIYKSPKIAEMNYILSQCNIVYTRQKINGTWWALLAAEKWIFEDHSLIFFGDMYIDTEKDNVIEKIYQLYAQKKTSIVVSSYFSEKYREIYWEIEIKNGYITTTTKRKQSSIGDILLAIWCFILDKAIFNYLWDLVKEYNYKDQKEISLMSAINILCTQKKVINYTSYWSIFDFWNMNERINYIKNNTLHHNNNVLYEG